MNLNELNPTQIILLTLLVSFVTSIATGIVTVSLVNQAPPVVTDTIHKVYEKTIETIVPGEQTATVIENNKTVIISEEDFVIDAVKKNSKSLARIYSYSENKNKEKVKEFVSVGLFISKVGDIVAQKSDFIKEEKLIEKDLFISVASQELKLNLNKDLIENDFVFLKTEKLEKPIAFNSIEIENSDDIKLGQSIIVLGGDESDMLLTGVVSNLTRNKIIIAEATEEKEAETKIIVEKIETNLNPTNLMTALINLDGKVIGIRLDNNHFTPINSVQNAFNSTTNSLAVTEEKNK
ncbi:serine protease [Patescibacteria group bacterium]|nr:serine protease [Patescibacteria group bacterium]